MNCDLLGAIVCKNCNDFDGVICRMAFYHLGYNGLTTKLIMPSTVSHNHKYGASKSCCQLEPVVTE